MYKGKYSFTIYDGEEETLIALLDNCRQLAKYLNITLNCARNLANRLLDREYLILKSSKQKISLLNNSL